MPPGVTWREEEGGGRERVREEGERRGREKERGREEEEKREVKWGERKGRIREENGVV